VASAALLSALRLTAAVWTLLLGAAALRPAWGDAATLGGVAAAAALVARARAAPGRSRGLGALPPSRILPAAGLAGAAGLASLPAWLAALAAAGGALGLAVPAPPAPAGPLRSLCDLALGPLLEEMLYRERLLPALRAALGVPPALLLSSALFALPHGEPWAILAAFGAGLALGGAFLATGSLGVCVAYHAGLNLAAAAWLRGRYPSLAPAPSAAAAALLLGAAVLRARARRSPP
jgi:membrane protease YdiL (CAAX protease family)